MILDINNKHNLREDVNVDLYKDKNPHTIDKKIVKKTLIQADACILPFGDLCFDVVLPFYLLEHLNTHIKTLNDLKRISRHGLIVVLLYFINKLIVQLFGKPNPKHSWVFPSAFLRTGYSTCFRNYRISLFRDRLGETSLYPNNSQ